MKPSIEDKIDLNLIDEIFFTSPSTINNFFEEYKSIPEKVKIKCIGEVTLKAALKRGLQAEVIKDDLS